MTPPGTIYNQGHSFNVIVLIHVIDANCNILEKECWS